MLLDEQGTAAKTTAQAAEIRREHVSDIEAACTTNANISASNTPPDHAPTIMLRMSAAFQIHSSFIRKSTIPRETRVLDPTLLPTTLPALPLTKSCVSVCLFVKTGLCSQQAEVLKGIDKPAMLMASYRSLLLEGHFIKHHNRFLRARLMDLCKLLILDTQCRGIRAKSTDFPAHLVRSFMQVAKLPGRIGIIVLADIKSVFYTVCEIAHSPPP